MARGANKQTIKFQKKNLKRTIERRRQTSKVRKQILERKEKQRAKQYKEKGKSLGFERSNVRSNPIPDAKAEKPKDDTNENRY